MSYTKGLHDLGNGTWAYLQPDGSWGWSNAGLVVDGEASLLVDTLFDEHLTGEMLNTMKDATGIGGSEVTTLVNTHANGDHCYGNGLCTQAEIIASQASAREMDEVPPEMLAQFIAAAPDMGDLGDYFLHCFGAFDFNGIHMRKPTRTFSGEIDIPVGDRTVRLIEVGPAHTGGDVLAWVPDEQVIYTGDILFIDGTPIMWAGPVSNWIRACNRIIELAPAAIVPGHGPLTDTAGVRAMRDYLVYIDAEARKRYDAGMSPRDAAFDIALGDYSAWGDAERIGVNVHTLYRQYSGRSTGADTATLFGLMAELHKARG